MTHFKTMALVAGAAALLSGAAMAQDGEWTRATDWDQETALGATVGQIADADLVDSSGQELGEVEYVLLNPDGAPGAVLVELEDDLFEEERLVQIELSAVTSQPDDDGIFDMDNDIDLVTDMTQDDIAALETYTRP